MYKDFVEEYLFIQYYTSEFIAVINGVHYRLRRASGFYVH